MLGKLLRRRNRADIDLPFKDFLKKLRKTGYSDLARELKREIPEAFEVPYEELEKVPFRLILALLYIETERIKGLNLMMKTLLEQRALLNRVRREPVWDFEVVNVE